MRLQPYGRVLPVHCCCDPVKRLGWVPVPGRLRMIDMGHGEGQVTFIAGRDARDLWTGEPLPAPRIHTEIARLTITRNNWQETFLAVKSADIPIETWRRIPGFVEDTTAAHNRLVCVPTLRPGDALRPGTAVRGEGVPAAAEQQQRPGAAGVEGAGRHEAGPHADKAPMTY